MRKKFLSLVVLLFLIIGCKGDVGPAGPVGPVGAQGPRGPVGPPGSGKFAVYQGTIDDYVFCFIMGECAESSPDTVMAIFAWVGDPDFAAWELLGGYDTENLTARWFDFGVTEIGGPCYGCFMNCTGLPYYVLVILE